MCKCGHTYALSDFVCLCVISIISLISSVESGSFTLSQYSDYEQKYMIYVTECMAN